MNALRPIAALLAVAIGTVAAVAAEPPDFPTSGKAGPGLEPLDAAVVAIMKRHGFPGGALAVTNGGKLVMARGYGWADLNPRTPAEPTTLFGMASLSKAVTAVAVLKLVEQGKLKLDDPAFALLGHLKPPRGARVDPRLAEVTVRQLLNHSGGWDQAKSGDPVNWATQAQYQGGGRVPITADYLISQMMARPLDFAPGTDAKYSNFGYIVLGEVIEKASGRPYGQFVKEHVLAPAGVKGMTLHPATGKYLPNEARRYLAGTDTELPAWKQKYLDPTGGWASSAVDLARFLTALDGSRGEPVLKPETLVLMTEPPPPPLKPRPDGTYFGLGWDRAARTAEGPGFYKNGNWYGMRCAMARRPNGVAWVLLFNASADRDAADAQGVVEAIKEVRANVEKIGTYPDIDLFGEFP